MAKGSESAMELAARILSVRQMSEAELYGRLTEKGIEDASALEAVYRMSEMGYVNDVEYAASIVRRCASKGYGSYRLKAELSKRKVPEDIAREALAEFSSPEREIDRFVNSRLKGGAMDRTTRRRISDALARRGFTWEEIRAAMRRYDDSEDEECP